MQTALVIIDILTIFYFPYIVGHHVKGEDLAEIRLPFLGRLITLR